VRSYSANRRLRSTGFTLLELLITITILVIVTVVAVPSMNKMIHRKRIIAVANEIVTAAKFAQNEAIIRKERMIMTMDTANPHHWLIYIQPRNESAANASIPSSAEIVRELWLNESLELVPDETSFGENKKVQFLPNGSISGVTGNSESQVNLRGADNKDKAAAIAVCSKNFPEAVVDVRLGGMLGDPGGRTVDTIRRQDGKGTDDCSAPNKGNW